ncbi:hypothetical protein FOS14_17245 [Skermania sp. ID1734]|nr:hypothetical protein FOS14_17245 [Skermania sp. ID1734]
MATAAAERRARWPRWSVVASVLMTLQLIVRALVLSRGNFYWDDLILIGRAGRLSLFSAQFLLDNHDGHLMPGAFLIAGVVTRLAPYEWVWAAATLLVLQACASVAVLRLLRLLLRDRPITLVPLVIYLFGPLTLPSFVWWAAGLNALPLQIGLAWVTGDAILLMRTGRLRYAYTGTAAFAFALLCFEKSILVPLVAFVVVALRNRIDGRKAVRGAAALWVGCGIVAVTWVAVYVSVIGLPLGRDSAAQTVGLIEHGTFLGLLPALIGGPLSWQRWLPSPPWADPAPALVVLAWLLVLGAVVIGCYAKRDAWRVGLAVGAYVVLCEAAMVLARSGPNTAYELAQTLRYFTDSSVVIAAGMALVIAAPWRRRIRVPRQAVVGATALFLVASLWSTATFTRSWQLDDTANYLATARSSLADNTGTPMLDQPVPPRVLLPIAYPDNLISHVFSALPVRSAFADSTPVLRMLDDSGHVIPAGVGPARDIRQGPVPRCGYRIDGLTTVALTGALPEWNWTAELNYLASRDGSIIVWFPHGRAVTVPVRQGLHQVYVRLRGSGDALNIQAATSGLSLCLGAGPIGGVLPKSAGH